jgi:hypothetical protein
MLPVRAGGNETLPARSVSVSVYASGVGNRPTATGRIRKLPAESHAKSVAVGFEPASKVASAMSSLALP